MVKIRITMLVDNYEISWNTMYTAQCADWHDEQHQHWIQMWLDAIFWVVTILVTHQWLSSTVGICIFHMLLYGNDVFLICFCYCLGKLPTWRQNDSSFWSSIIIPQLNRIKSYSDAIATTTILPLYLLHCTQIISKVWGGQNHAMYCRLFWHISL